MDGDEVRTRYVFPEPADVRQTTPDMYKFVVTRIENTVDTSIPCLKGGAARLQRLFTAGYLSIDMLALFVNGMKWKSSMEVRIFRDSLRTYQGQHPATLAHLYPKAWPFSLVSTFTIYEEVYKLDKDFDAFILPCRKRKNLPFLKWPHESKALRGFFLESAVSRRRRAASAEQLQTMWEEMWLECLDLQVGRNEKEYSREQMQSYAPVCSTC